ncbi:MAG: sigma-70 family RNA polymerase sigma factor [Bacteroidetes bacterium]|nr:sigma-70 family RNA polymerase sigma factor [Bacteroidota bacterium]
MTPIKQIQSILTDDELLEDFQQNENQQALASLYLRYSDLVYGVCLKYLKNAELSKDAVMDIYQEVSKKLQSHNVENFKSWLYVLSKNFCLMQLRKDKKSTIIEFDSNAFMQSEDFSHLDIALQKEREFKKLETCLQHLNSEQHTVIEMFYLQQKCYNQIVEETKMDWNKIRSLVQNGRRNLKICMDKND